MGATLAVGITALHETWTGRQPMATLLDGRAWIREALTGWPDHLSADGRAFLETLPYRVRRAVELVYGQELRVEHAASVMRVSGPTIRRYLQAAYRWAARRHCLSDN